MVQLGGETYFALWNIVVYYVLGKKIWNHFALSQYIILHVQKTSQKNTPISHMQIPVFYQFMIERKKEEWWPFKVIVNEVSFPSSVNGTSTLVYNWNDLV
jgi:hypothetical protein